MNSTSFRRRSHRGLSTFCTLLLTFVALSVLLFWPNDAHAYGWMVRHEYSACIQCHADPSGGGLLTGYGRAESETLLRTHYGKTSDEEEAGSTYGNFAWGLWKGDTQDRLLLGADARELYYTQSTQNAPSISKFILMQADAQAQLHLDRFRANGSIGYAEQGALPAALTRNPDKNLVSRTHWLGVELDEDKKMMIRAGRVNLPFGLRSIEHTLWARTVTRTDINSGQEDGVAFSYNGGQLRGEVMAVLGNLQLRPYKYHEYGYSGYVEYTPKSRLAVGVSSLLTHAALDIQTETALWRHAHGLFGRYSPKQWVVLGLEQDLVLFSQPANSSQPHNNIAGTVGYLNADFEPVQGIHLMTTLEDQQNDFSRGGFSCGAWAGAAWFFLPHADVRADVIYQNVTTNGSAHTGITTFLAQAHVFL